MRSIAIGLLGAGHVGAGVLRILAQNHEAISRRLDAKVEVKRVFVRDLERVREVDIPREKLTTDVGMVLDDPDIRIVVELIGGVEPARSWVIQALRAGKHVVTANKAMLAAHAPEVFAEATARGLSVYFEASVAGGIPILRSLREGLASDRIESLAGIVNGTSNYILDAMTRNGMTYEDALRAAQLAGFAEADPTLDVDGHDAAQKLALLCLVAFGKRIDAQAIPTEGIRNIRAFDIRIARECGYVIKSVAMVDTVKGGLRPRVHPALVPEDAILAGVHGSYNAVLVESRALGRSLYYGRGAGAMPTGVSVVSDIIEVCRDLMSFTGPDNVASVSSAQADPVGLDDLRSENYLCVHVPNVPGVLGRVASALGRHDVSIKQMNQDTPRPGQPVDMVIWTEEVEERCVTAALAELATFSDIVAPTHRLRILAPDPLD